MKYHLFAAGAGALLTVPAWADTAPAYRLDDIVVTATRSETPLKDALLDISVLTKEDFATAGQDSLPQLLATQPGVQYSSYGGMGQPASVFLRGAGGDHTLLLLDGIPLNSPNQGIAPFDAIPATALKRAEIRLGPASSLYGTGAAGGVVDVSLDDEQSSFSMGVGDRNTLFTQASVAGHTEASRGYLGVSRWQTDGYNVIGNPANYYFNPDRDGWTATSVVGKAEKDIADGKAGALYFHNQGKTDFDARADATDTTYRNLDVAAFYLKGKLRPDWNSLLRLSAVQDRIDSVEAFSSQAKANTWQLTWQNDAATSMGQVVFGIDAGRQKVDFPDASRDNVALWLGLNGHAGDHAYGLFWRHDHDSQFGEFDSGNLAWGYRASPNTHLHATVGTGFRAPTFNDLYWPGSGNPDLKPETSRSAEAGIDQKLGPANIKLTAFASHFDDLIQWAPDASGWWTPANVASARISGATLSGKLDLGGWKLEATLTGQEPEAGDSGKLLINRARIYGALVARTTLAGWSLRGELTGAGPRWADAANLTGMGGYGVVNLVAEKAVTKEWTLLARCNNIFDKGYELAKDYPAPGASIYFALSWHPR